MVQHASADDMIEVRPKLGDALERQLPQSRLWMLCLRFSFAVASMLALLKSMPVTCALRPSQRMFRGLRRAATGDEDAAVVAKGSSGQKEMGFGPPPLAVPGGA